MKGKECQPCGDTWNKGSELKNDNDEVTEHQEKARRFQDQLTDGVTCCRKSSSMFAY